MVRATLILATLVAATGISASAFHPFERATCPAGDTHLVGDDGDGAFDVCCPGASIEINNTTYCCVGSQYNDAKKRKVCIGITGGCYGDDDDDDDDDDNDGETAMCASAVPATATNFSSRVARATATANASGNAGAPMVTAAPWMPWAAMAGGAVVNAALLG